MSEDAINAVLDEYGTRTMDLPSMLVGSIPCAVTVIAPTPSVATVDTYFEGPELDSQPQLFAPGSVVATDD